AAAEQQRHRAGGPLARVLPYTRVAVASRRPPQLALFKPYTLERFAFISANEVIRLVQQDRRAFDVVDRVLEERRVQGDDGEGVIGGGVRGLMSDVVVPPIVGAAVADQMTKRERLA